MMFSYWTQDEIFLKMCRINHVRLPYCFMSDTLPFQGLDAEGGVGVDTGGLGPEWAALLPKTLWAQIKTECKVAIQL